jgi:hypothetical protein
MSIIRPSVAFKAGADWVSAEVRAYITDQVATHVDTVSDLRDSDLERTRWVYVGAKGALYRLNLSSGAADDGDTVIQDNVGRRYEKEAGAGPGGTFWDAAVDDIAARGAYDDEDAGFAVFVADSGTGRAALYIMGTGGSADWSDPFYWTGPAGQDGDAYEAYGVSIYRADGIATGGYYAERRANAASTQAVVFAEIVDGDPGAEADIYLEVDGEAAYGPVTVEVGTPFLATGLSVAVAEGDRVSWVVASVIGGAVRDLFAKSYGAVS